MTSDSGYTIWSDTFSSGGSEGASSTNYNISDTIGEQANFASSTSDYSGGFGFRYMTNDALTLSLSSNSLDLGTLTTASTQTVSHTMTVQSNSSSVSVVVTGDTLESGANSITPIGAVATAAIPGTSQFGLNVIYASGGSPSPLVSAPYDTAGLYGYTSGSQIMTSATPVNATVYTVNYIANISGSEAAGSYSTTLTYTATANF
jgi:hypothetical protein